MSIRDEEPLENVIPATKGVAARRSSQGATGPPSAAFSTNSLASTGESSSTVLENEYEPITKDVLFLV